MERFLCSCGNIISDVCGNEGVIFHYSQMNDDQIYEGQDELGLWKCGIYKGQGGLELWQCDKCGCLIIDNPNKKSEVLYFKPTDKKCLDIFNKFK